MMIYILFIVGFFCIVKGADLLVDGSASIAKRLGISNLVIGLTVVSFGTSAPELVVNVISSINGSADIATGNIIGSNVANILLGLGVAAIIFPVAVGRGTLFKEIPFSIFTALILLLFANFSPFLSNYTNVITRIEGLFFLLLFGLFIFYTTKIAKTGVDNQESIVEYGWFRSIALVILGLLGLRYGGDWIVNGATHIAKNIGFSESFIGLTIVAVGTSLPEVVVSAVAAFKKNTDMAIGNIVGSNIFNILWVLGLSSIINPLKYNSALNIDIAFLLLISVLLFFIVWLSSKKSVSKRGGVLFICLYAGYLVFLINRG